MRLARSPASRLLTLTLTPTLTLSLALACAPESGDSGDSDTEVNQTLQSACEALCAEEIACGTTSLSEAECPDACLADVGTQTDACAQALESLATCLQGSCDDAACDAELTERDVECGGRG